MIGTFYSLNFHIIDVNTFFNAIDRYIILKSVFLPNMWARQQYQYLKHGGDNPVANKKNDADAASNFTVQVVASCVFRK